MSGTFATSGQKRNCRPCAAVSSATARSGMNPGAIESYGDSASQPEPSLGSTSESALHFVLPPLAVGMAFTLA